MNQSSSAELIIIGGGIMGLMTAYYASAFTSKIIILEKSTIANKEAASFSFTRSIRVDYLELDYARLAYEAEGLWLELQALTEIPFYERCGCLNIAHSSVSKDLSKTYAAESYKQAQKLRYPQETFNRESLKNRFPQFDADLGTLDTTGGYLRLPIITDLILGKLKNAGVTLIPEIETRKVTESEFGIELTTNKGNFNTKQLVITAGMGTNQLLEKISGNSLVLPIKYDRPKRKYYYPPVQIRANYLPDKFPVFAYTDYGFYGHPIYDIQKGAVKVAYFVPAGMRRETNDLTSIEAFVERCLPELANVPAEDITDADLCWYDIVDDNQFILGALPGFDRIIVGTGWRGTGYKFAPLIGKILSQLSLQGQTVYDVQSFNPRRFLS